MNIGFNDVFSLVGNRFQQNFLPKLNSQQKIIALVLVILGGLVVMGEVCRHFFKAEKIDDPRLIPQEPEIQKLPKDPMVHIFSFLDMGDLGNCHSVCKQWNERAKDDLLWKKIAQERGLSLIQDPTKSVKEQVRDAKIPFECGEVDPIKKIIIINKNKKSHKPDYRDPIKNAMQYLPKGSYVAFGVGHGHVAYVYRNTNGEIKDLMIDIEFDFSQQTQQEVARIEKFKRIQIQGM